MSETLKLEIQTICIVHIFAIMLSLIFFMMLYMKAKNDYALKAFFVMQFSMIGWMVFKIFKTVSPTIHSRWWFIVGYYACACILEIAFLEFSYAYHTGHSIPKKLRYSLYTFPVVQLLIVMTNPYHHLFYATYTFKSDSFGILFYVHTLIVYTFIAVGFIYCYRTFRIRFANRNILYKYFISATILIPLIINILFITKIIHKFVRTIGIPVVFDITPIVFTWSTLIFVYATFRYDFLYLSPLMKHEIVHKLDTPICILDSTYTPIYANEKLDAIFNTKGLDLLQGAINQHTFRKIEKNNGHFNLKNRHFIVSTQQVRSIKETQYLLSLREITSYTQIKRELEERNKLLERSNIELQNTIKTLKETSKIGARNYVANEMHDIIGHSLVVVIKLLEVAKIYFTQNPSESLLALEDATISLQKGIDDMNAINQKESHVHNYSGASLRKELQRLLKYISKANVKTNLHVKGLEYAINEKTYDVIKKVCTELITNALKHSNAKEILINVTLTKHTIQVIVMDNGIGTDDLILGNGLKGIQNRLKLIHGEITYITAKNEGFMSKISITKEVV